MLITSKNLSEGVTGSNVRDTENRMRFSREGAERLGQGIRAGMTGNNISPNRNQYRISKASGVMAKNVAENTVELQKIMESQGNETRAELNRLLKMMASAQKLTGEKSVSAIKEIVKQTEKVTIAAGESKDDLRRVLGIDSVQKQLYGGSIGEQATSGIKGFFGVDKGATFSEGVKQAFEPSRLFGNSGFFGLGANRNQRINAVREAKIEAASQEQSSGLSSVLGELGVINQTNNTTRTSNTNKIFSGSDRTSEPEMQTDFLEKILKELEKLNDKDFGSGGGIFGGIGKTIGSVVTGIVTTLARVSPIALAAVTTGAAIAGINEMSKDPEAQEDLSQRVSNIDNLYKTGLGLPTAAETDTSTTVRATATGGLIKRGSSGNTNAGSGPSTFEEKEFMITTQDENGAEVIKQVTKEEFENFYNTIENSQTSASVNVLPTSSAVENLTGATTSEKISPIINNITNNNVSSSGGGSQSTPLIAMKDTIRDSTSVIQQRFNKVYA